MAIGRLPPNIRPNNAVPERPTVCHLVPVGRPVHPSDQPDRDTAGRPATGWDKVSPTCNRQVVGSSPTAGSENPARRTGSTAGSSTRLGEHS